MIPLLEATGGVFSTGIKQRGGWGADRISDNNASSQLVVFVLRANFGTVGASLRSAILSLIIIFIRGGCFSTSYQFLFLLADLVSKHASFCFRVYIEHGVCQFLKIL